MGKALLSGFLAIACLGGKAVPLPEGAEAYRKGDFPAAQRLLRTAAQKGDARAQLMLGNIALQGDDAADAAAWYRRAADRGLAAAQAKLGVCYAAGNGVPQSDLEAVKWYQLAAAQGEVQAAASLGYLYQFGEGVPHDQAEAARWYGVAAASGDRLSQNMLGQFYTIGAGVTRNRDEAARWYRRASEQGDPQSQYELARAYYEGAGVARDPVMSYYWATIAIDDLPERHEAREPVLRLLAALARDLSETQMAEASRRATQWLPAPGTKENYASPDGTLRAIVAVTGPGGESRVEIRDDFEILLSRSYASPDGQHGCFVEHAEWSSDSRYFAFNPASSGGHQPWRNQKYVYDRRVNRIEETKK